MPQNQTKKVRYAVVGLGHITQTAMMPGFKNAKNSEMVALVSSDKVKLDNLGRKYGVEKLCSYEDFDELVKSGDIDAVYIATPNTLHTEFAIKAIENGVHVLCEKPLAASEAEAQRIVEASFENNVKLMVAYRLHFDKGNLHAIKLAQSGKIGKLRMFHSLFSYQLNDPDNIRLQAKLGGGAIWDIGIYCINAARYIFEAEPKEVFAFTSSDDQDQRFKQVPEMWTVAMTFPDDRVAAFTCSFGATTTGYYEVVGTKGKLKLENAYEYSAPMELHLTVDEKEKTTKKFAKRDQFGAELSYFSDCILNNTNPEPSGLEGLADVRIIKAIERSAEVGTSIAISAIKKSKYPELDQQVDMPAVDAPEPLHATSPQGESASRGE